MKNMTHILPLLLLGLAALHGGRLTAQVVTPEDYRKKVEKTKETASLNAKIMLDQSLPIEERLAAASKIGTVYDPADVGNLLNLVKSDEADVRIRRAALDRVTPYLKNDKEAIDKVMGISAAEEQDLELRKSSLSALAVLDFSGLAENDFQPSYKELLHKLTKSKVDEFKEGAYGTLAARQDEMILKELKEGVLNPGKSSISATKCIQFLGVNPKPDLIKDLAPALDLYSDVATKAELLRLLPASSSNRDAVAAVLEDQSQPETLRLAAIDGLSTYAPEGLAKSLAGSIRAAKGDTVVTAAALDKLQGFTTAKLNLQPAQAAGISTAAQEFLSNDDVGKTAKRAAWDYLKAHDKQALKVESSKILDSTRDPELKAYFTESLK